MHRKIAQLLRLPSLLLAAALQILPIARTALPAAQATADVLAIIFRWAAGAAAALGGVHAVSGASTVITNPLSTNAVEGKSFVLRLTTAPNQAHYWTASSLPTGINLVGTNGNSFWELLGTPTVSGTFDVGLTAKGSANSGASETTSATLVINIAPATVGTPPAITTQPASLVITQGQSAAFSVTATGTAPLTYFWLKGATVMTNGPNPTLTISNVQSGNAGTYSVIVSNAVSTITSSNATLTVIVPATAPTITTQPGNQIVNLGQTATFNVIATGTTPMSYFWRIGTTVLTNSASPTFAIPNAQTTNAGSYSVIVSNSLGTATSSNATLTVNVVIIAPGITAQPTNQLIYQGNNALLSVAASGTAPFGYQWRKNGAALADSAHLSGTQSNLLTIISTLTNDSGRYTVVITNSSGSITSQVATLTVTNPIAWTMTIQVTGNGSVSPNYNGEVLTIGQNYSMTATPSNGYVFSKWTGGIYSTASVLNFVMQRGLALQANFIPSPLIPLKGTYYGLFFDTNGVSQLGSGFFTVTLTTAGSFTGSLQIGSTKWPLKGQFDATGAATINVKRNGMNPLTVQLQLDLFGGSEQITGTVAVSDGSWLAELTANRDVFNAKTNPCPAAGTYTLLIPGIPGATGSSAGDGYGLVKVTTAGNVILTGVLADNTPVSQSTFLSKSGDWPLYVARYSGRGSILGWLTFTNTPGDDLHGTLSWIRPVQPSVPLFTMGFTVATEATGSHYTPPSGDTRVLNFVNGMVVLSDGNLAASITNQVQVNANNTVVSQDDNTFQMKIKAANGLFAGKAQDPATGKNLSFKGVVLQKQNAGGGFFLNQNQSGEVYIGQ